MKFVVVAFLSEFSWLQELIIIVQASAKKLNNIFVFLIKKNLLNIQRILSSLKTKQTIYTGRQVEHKGQNWRNMEISLFPTT